MLISPEQKSPIVTYQLSQFLKDLVVLFGLLLEIFDGLLFSAVGVDAFLGFEEEEEDDESVDADAFDDEDDAFVEGDLRVEVLDLYIFIEFG